MTIMSKLIIPRKLAYKWQDCGSRKATKQSVVNFGTHIT